MFTVAITIQLNLRVVSRLLGFISVNQYAFLKKWFSCNAQLNVLHVTYTTEIFVLIFTSLPRPCTPISLSIFFSKIDSSLLNYN